MNNKESRRRRNSSRGEIKNGDAGTWSTSSSSAASSSSLRRRLGSNDKMRRITTPSLLLSTENDLMEPLLTETEVLQNEESSSVMIPSESEDVTTTSFDVEQPQPQSSSSSSSSSSHHSTSSSSSSSSSSIPFLTGPFFSNLGIPAESVILLNIVAVIWGTQHSVIKLILDDNNIDASGLTVTRFGLAALVASACDMPSFGPVIRRLLNSDGYGNRCGSRREAEMMVMRGDYDDDEEEEEQKDAVEGEEKEEEESVLVEEEDEEQRALTAWRWGSELGFWMFLGYAFQAIGLEYTTAQRSGFLLYLNVKFVPFLARIILGRQISSMTWISAFTAFTGTALLSLDTSSSPTSSSIIGTSSFNIGDAWSIAAAIASAMFILRMESASNSIPNSATILNTTTLWIVTTSALLWSLSQNIFHNGHHIMEAVTQTVYSIFILSKTHPFALMYLSVVTTAIANYVQTKAQKGVTAERASVIYAMDPVYGAFFAYEILGERLGMLGVGGACLITIAAATNAFLDLGRNNGDVNGSLDDGDGDSGER